MRGFRAKDADRDRFVELIEAAYVDGQLGDADRDLRVSRALTARTLDDLETLTRDLQLPAGHVPAAAATTRTVRPQRLVGMLVALGAVVALLGVGVAGLVVFSASGGPDGSTASVDVSREAVPVPAGTGEETGVVEEAASFAMTPGEVRRFVRAHEREFGTLDVYEVGFYPTRVGVEVPVRGSRPRYERWAWTGAWQQDTEASAVTGPDEIIDLGGLDVRRLFHNIALARKTLDVQRGRLTHVLVNHWIGDVPSVNIYIGNTFNESGYLKTTLSGEVLDSFPYEG